MDDTLRRTQRDAEARADDAAARIVHAQALLHAGFRAAAWHELCAALALGESVPEELRDAFTFEKPAGTRWELEPIGRARETVAQPVDDARFARAWVRAADRVLPLVIVLGAVCEDCVRGRPRCDACGGAGYLQPNRDAEAPSTFFDPYYDRDASVVCHLCPPGLCASCRGTSFRVTGSRRGSSCRHVHRDEGPIAGEWIDDADAACLPRPDCPECGGTGEVPDSLDNYASDPYSMAPCPCTRVPAAPHGRLDFVLARCERCGLASVRDACGHFAERILACGGCGLFDCAC